METIRIDIVNPKAKKIIEHLAALNLIDIREKDPMKSFASLLRKLKNKKSPTLEKITREVESIRSKRHGNKVR